jgi:hypothetical protein
VRTPEAPPDAESRLLGTISEARWQEIKQCLAERKLNLDAVMVGVRAVEGGQLLLPQDSTAPQRSLRDLLQEMAWHYSALAHLPKPLTKIQQAERCEQELAAFRNALATLVRSYNADGDDLTEDQRLKRVGTNTALASALTKKIAERQERIVELRAMGSSSAHNARTVLGDYWRKLAPLWLAIVGSTGPKRQQHLRRVLFACTPQTMVAVMSAPELERRAARFVKEFFESRRGRRAGRRKRRR